MSSLKRELGAIRSATGKHRFRSSVDDPIDRTESLAGQLQGGALDMIPKGAGNIRLGFLVAQSIGLSGWKSGVVRFPGLVRTAVDERYNEMMG